MTNMRKLIGLLSYLSQPYVSDKGQYQGIKYVRIFGGYNGTVYQTQIGGQELAIKFTLRDERRRAWREFASLTAIQTAGLQIAPRPILLDEQNYRLPVVVTTWLDGAVMKAPPQSTREWELLMAHYATIHKVSQSHSNVRLPPYACSPEKPSRCKTFISEEITRLPKVAWNRQLEELAFRLEVIPFPVMPEIDAVLCRNDANTLNFVRYPDRWMSVDWDNSGLGDPAYDLADVFTHPKYREAEVNQVELLEMYSKRRMIPDLHRRVKLYRVTMLCWWPFRLTRLIHEKKQGLDIRPFFNETDANWRQKARDKYLLYLHLAFKALAEL